MAVISVDRADLGMVLAAPVTDRRGRLLIPAGKELDEKFLKALRMWGVTQIEVEGEAEDPVDPFADLPPEVMEQVQAEVQARFARNNLQHPLIAGLYQRAVLKRAEALSQTPSEHQPEEASAHAS
ncbi:MAG: hypothetical protein R3E98_04300 [Gemmatimonadota bacterium]|nr:hypothetical protein [Gemmatimonadota bacterium]